MGASPCRAVEDAIESELEEWYRYEGNGFALSVPPDFEDIRDPEVHFDFLFLSRRKLSETVFLRILDSSWCI